MEANELMVGDWVTFKDCQHENPILIKIIAIGFQADEENDCLVQIDGNKACDIITIDDEIVGIPLTAEILEKNGFEKISLKSGRVVYSLADYDLEAEEMTDSIWRIEYFNVEASFPSCRDLVGFVHEIQHFLNSHIIEKEIEL